MKFKLTKTVEAEWCTHEFLNGGKHLANHVWAIAKYKDGTYAIVHKITNEIANEFKEKQKIYDNTWLLTLLDGTQCIMYYDEDKIKISKSFLKLIYVFEKIVLIENLEGKRKLLRKNGFFSEEFTWFVDEADEHKILQLPNGKKTILKKQGLEVLNFEFDDYIFSAHIKNVVIVSLDNWDCLVRISDFRISLRHPDISTYNVSKKPTNIIDYVIISCSDTKKTLMRVEDFEVSDRFDDIKPINHEYALVTTYAGKEQILRLSDFKIAKFD